MPVLGNLVQSLKILLSLKKVKKNIYDGEMYCSHSAYCTSTVVTVNYSYLDATTSTSILSLACHKQMSMSASVMPFYSVA